MDGQSRRPSDLRRLQQGPSKKTVDEAAWPLRGRRRHSLKYSTAKHEVARVLLTLHIGAVKHSHSKHVYLSGLCGEEARQCAHISFATATEACFLCFYLFAMQFGRAGRCAGRFASLLRSAGPRESPGRPSGRPPTRPGSWFPDLARGGRYEPARAPRPPASLGPGAAAQRGRLAVRVDHDATMRGPAPALALPLAGAGGTAVLAKLRARARARTACRAKTAKPRPRQGFNTTLQIHV